MDLDDNYDDVDDVLIITPKLKNALQCKEMFICRYEFSQIVSHPEKMRELVEKLDPNWRERRWYRQIVLSHTFPMWKLNLDKEKKYFLMKKLFRKKRQYYFRDVPGR